MFSFLDKWNKEKLQSYVYYIFFQEKALSSSLKPFIQILIFYMRVAVSKMEVVSVLTELKVQWAFSHRWGHNHKMSEVLRRKATQSHARMIYQGIWLRRHSPKKQCISSLLKDWAWLTEQGEREYFSREREACAKALGWRARRQVTEGQCSWVAERKQKGGMRWDKRGGLGHILEQGSCRHAQDFRFYFRSSGKTLEAFKPGRQRILFSVRNDHSLWCGDIISTHLYKHAMQPLFRCSFLDNENNPGFLPTLLLKTQVCNMFSGHECKSHLGQWSTPMSRGNFLGM